jgi:hypothetical protein
MDATPVLWNRYVKREENVVLAKKNESENRRRWNGRKEKRER